MIRAKFSVVAKTQFVDGWRVELQAVTRTSEENAAFFKWTPSGKIEMAVLREETANQFEVGSEYYIDFTPAPGE